MSYCEPGYLCFFLPVVLLLYQVLPQRHRWKLLLLSSYVFFWSISGKLLIYLLLSTVSIHYVGLWLSSLQDERDVAARGAEKDERKAIKARYLKKQRTLVVCAVLLHIGFLVVLKYSNFLGTNINTLLGALHAPFAIKIHTYLMPVGISFYTLQAVSYIFDVYRGTIRADKNLGRLALFMGFFPQIMEGPICRYGDTAAQLWQGEKITYRNLTFGFQRILYGLAKKLIIADRLNPLVKAVFSDYGKYDGGVIAIAAVCYTIQLYMDFSGSIDVVIGSAEIFGVHLPENFRQPFFSRTISEFWMRWHITLGTWFKDYIFYPMSLSHPLKKLTSHARKALGNHFGPLISGSIALFCVWICNGLWHGAAWHYVLFGMFHFAIILTGNIIAPFVISGAARLHINRESAAYRGMQITRSVFFIIIGELIFRASGGKVAVEMLHKIFTNFTLASVSDGSVFKLGVDRHDCLLLAVAIMVVFIVGLLKEKGVRIREAIASKNVAFRWAVYYGLLLSILIFGAYGVGYTPVDPIYASF